MQLNLQFTLHSSHTVHMRHVFYSMCMCFCDVVRHTLLIITRIFCLDCQSKTGCTLGGSKLAEHLVSQIWTPPVGRCRLWQHKVLVCTIIPTFIFDIIEVSGNN